MSQLSAFFKGSDTQLGVFYPEHYIVATFDSIDRANGAAATLRRAGFSEDEVIAVSGQDLVNLMNEEMTPLGVVMTAISRFLDTEAHYSDRDVKDAKHGAATLAVYCAHDRTKRSAWKLIAPTAPIRARYYAFSGVEHLAGES
jgi:hypothetical protein